MLIVFQDKYADSDTVFSKPTLASPVLSTFLHVSMCISERLTFSQTRTEAQGDLAKVT